MSADTRLDNLTATKSPAEKSPGSPTTVQNDTAAQTALSNTGKPAVANTQVSPPTNTSVTETPVPGGAETPPPKRPPFVHYHNGNTMFFVYDHAVPPLTEDEQRERLELIAAAQRTLRKHFISKAEAYGLERQMEAMFRSLMPARSSTQRYADQAGQGSVLDQLEEVFEAQGLKETGRSRIVLPDGDAKRNRTARGVAKSTLLLMFHFMIEAGRKPETVPGEPIDSAIALEVYSGLINLRGDEAVRKLIGEAAIEFLKREAEERAANNQDGAPSIPQDPQ